MLIACLPANLYRFGYDNLVIYNYQTLKPKKQKQLLLEQLHPL
jgi:hypothetical protein